MISVDNVYYISQFNKVETTVFTASEARLTINEMK